MGVTVIPAYRANATVTGTDIAASEGRSTDRDEHGRSNHVTVQHGVAPAA